MSICFFGKLFWLYITNPPQILVPNGCIIFQHQRSPTSVVFNGLSWLTNNFYFEVYSWMKSLIPGQLDILSSSFFLITKKQITIEVILFDPHHSQFWIRILFKTSTSLNGPKANYTQIRKPAKDGFKSHPTKMPVNFCS